MPLDKYYLTRKGDDWRLDKAGSDRAVVKASTKAEAMQQSMDYMRAKGGANFALGRIAAKKNRFHALAAG